MHVRRWEGERQPERAQLEEEVRDENLSCSTWSNGPGAQYLAHSHSYTKIIYVVEGSIRFDVPEMDDHVMLQPGDKLELPAGLVHSAQVGQRGVVCLEAHRPAKQAGNEERRP